MEHLNFYDCGCALAACAGVLVIDMFLLCPSHNSDRLNLPHPKSVAPPLQELKCIQHTIENQDKASSKCYS
jgi:hypothetical protein